MPFYCISTPKRNFFISSSFFFIYKIHIIRILSKIYLILSHDLCKKLKFSASFPESKDSSLDTGISFTIVFSTHLLLRTSFFAYFPQTPGILWNVATLDTLKAHWEKKKKTPLLGMDTQILWPFQASEGIDVCNPSLTHLYSFPFWTVLLLCLSLCYQTARTCWYRWSWSGWESSIHACSEEISSCQFQDFASALRSYGFFSFPHHFS